LVAQIGVVEMTEDDYVFRMVEKRHRQWRELGEKRGTEDDPVIIPWPWETTSRWIMYTLDHAHTSDGSCWKNRFGYPCKADNETKSD
jgi:hypothetical protein